MALSRKHYIVMAQALNSVWRAIDDPKQAEGFKRALVALEASLQSLAPDGPHGFNAERFAAAALAEDTPTA